MPPAEREKMQLERLQEVVKTALKTCPTTKKRFDEAGIKPEDIKTLKDIEKLP